MLHINKEEKNIFEKRTLAKFPKIIKDNNSINYNAGKEFDDYFRERFYLRNMFIQLYCDVKYYLSGDYYHFDDIIFNKKNHYAVLKDFYDYNEVPDNQILLTIKNINKLKTFCDNNNIKCYLLLAPNKNEVGSAEAYPAPLRQKTYIQTQKILKEIKSQTGVEILFPYRELVNLASTGEPVFFRMDDHWTDVASYVAYLSLMEKIKQDFKNVKVTKLEDFEQSKSNYVRVCPLYGFFQARYFSNLHLRDEKYLDREYTFLSPKGDIEEKHKSYEDDLYNKHFYINKDNSSAPNIYIYGDSFSQNIIPSIVSSFYETTSIFTFLFTDNDREEFLDIKRFEKDILKTKPDILVVIFAKPDRFRYLYRN